MGYWCGYLSGSRCRLLACGPADATASQKPQHLLPHLNPDWFYLSGTGLPRLSRKRGRRRGVTVVVIKSELIVRTEFLAVDGGGDGADEEVLEEVLFGRLGHVARLKQLANHVFQVLTALTNSMQRRVQRVSKRE